MKRFRGVFTALVTPFKNGHVDYNSLSKLLEQQLAAGVNGFVVNGTTAESPTLTEAEAEEIFQFVRKKTGDKVPLIMGTGTNSTQSSVRLSQRAERIGADAVLVVVPYYNKPPQRGLLEHFKMIATSIRIPVILYNVPTRTITALELDTIKKLSEHPNIVGIKEASGNIEFARQIRETCGEEFLLLSGDDATYDEFMRVGGDGVISVASHILPEAMIQVQASKHLDLINMLFSESNPIPVKRALEILRILETAECRLPLVELSQQNTDKLRKLLVSSRLVK